MMVIAATSGHEHTKGNCHPEAALCGGVVEFSTSQEGPPSLVETVALCRTRKLDNFLPERTVVPISRTYDSSSP
jgi:hypothetical protein